MNRGAKYNLKEAVEVFDGVFYEDDALPIQAAKTINIFNAKQVIGRDNKNNILKEFEKQKVKLREEDITAKVDVG